MGFWANALDILSSETFKVLDIKLDFRCLREHFHICNNILHSSLWFLLIFLSIVHSWCPLQLNCEILTHFLKLFWFPQLFLGGTFSNLHQNHISSFTLSLTACSQFSLRSPQNAPHSHPNNINFYFFLLNYQRTVKTQWITFVHQCSAADASRSLFQLPSFLHKFVGGLIFTLHFCLPFTNISLHCLYSCTVKCSFIYVF